MEAIEKVLEGKVGEEQLIALSFDEMSITPSLNFNTESLMIDGFVHLQDDPVINRDDINQHNDSDTDALKPEILD